MTGIELIRTERDRQITEEGFDPEHDRCHTGNELALAAACYAVNGIPGVGVHEWGDEDCFPFVEEFDRRRDHGRLRSLVIAGALIAAELDRLMAEEGGEAA
jgi:hypothetical protein